MRYLVIACILILGGCSFKQPQNKWELNAINAAQAYQKNFLSSYDVAAKKDLQRAVAHAKKSANLQTLAKIYLTKCAMQVSVLKDPTCSDFTKLQKVIQNSQLSAYKAFLMRNIAQEQIELLPKRYHKFAASLLKDDMNQTIKAMQNIEDIHSRFIAAALIKEALDSKQIDAIINLSSHRGYDKITKAWLAYKYKKFGDEKAKKILQIMQEE